MGTVSDEYQLYARECLRWAAETDDEEHRQAFLQMAKVWTQLAVHGHKVEAPSVAALAHANENIWGTNPNNDGLGCGESARRDVARPFRATGSVALNNVSACASPPSNLPKQCTARKRPRFTK